MQEFINRTQKFEFIVLIPEVTDSAQMALNLYDFDPIEFGTLQINGVGDPSFRIAMQFGLTEMEALRDLLREVIKEVLQKPVTARKPSAG